ncbi:MAG: phosphatase PAP2 family protein [Pseudomonadota bacterium]
MTGRIAACWLAAFFLFGAFPGIDLWVSGLFYDPASSSFPLAENRPLEFLRNAIWNAAEIATLVALIFGTFALLATPAPAIPGRIWAFALLFIFLGPLVLVNGVLKTYWGRARPADTDVFGGPHPFTPAWEWAGNCAANCSFVSGEAAGVTCLAILLGVAFWNRVRNRRALLVALGALIVIGAGMRVMKGRHYLSDAVWAVLLMVTLAHWLAARLRLQEVMDRVTWSGLRADGARIVAAAKNWGQTWRG